MMHKARGHENSVGQPVRRKKMAVFQDPNIAWLFGTAVFVFVLMSLLRPDVFLTWLI